VDVHMICLIGRTTLNYVLAFYTLKYLHVFLITRRSCPSAALSQRLI